MKPDYSRILVIPDLHVPYHHKQAIAFLAAVKAKYKPTHVICLGDEIDNHSISYHDHDPDLPSSGDELTAAIKHLGPLYKLFPQVDLVESNHGSLLYRKAKTHGLSKQFLRNYNEVVKAPAGWVWHDELEIKLPDGRECLFTHGRSKDVMKVVQLYGQCVVQGHFHTEFRIGHISTPRNLLFGMNSGCLVDKQSMAMAYDKTNIQRPIIGCSLIINSVPHLEPMLLKSGSIWTGALA